MLDGEIFGFLVGEGAIFEKPAVVGAETSDGADESGVG